MNINSGPVYAVRDRAPTEPGIDDPPVAALFRLWGPISSRLNTLQGNAEIWNLATGK